ncbi:MAG: VWA domain-containing protein [Chloracidobacterium sp.]|nr:VWA domain-containing protein [Chloracidobacterium sp.]
MFGIKNKLVITAILIASVSCLIAQTPNTKPKNDDEVIKVSSRLVVVPVSVTDANGNPVEGLTARDFRVLEEGKAQNIENVGSADKVPLEIALLFDVSASTDAMFKFQQETAAKFLREVLRPEDRATIYTIGQKPVLVQGRDVSERSIESVLTISATKGATAFFDTVSAAAKELRTKSPLGTRRVIVVISDGEDNFSEGLRMTQRVAESNISSGNPDPELKKVGKILALAQEKTKKAERSKVLKQLQDADSVFYSINPAGSSYQLNQISVFGQENMQTFADATGGSAYLPKFQPIDTKDALQNSGNTRKNKTTLDLIFRQLAGELRAQYLVQYYSEADFPVSKYVKLNVDVDNHGTPRVRARQGYYVKN